MDEWLKLTLLFIIGVYLGHLADILALAWHSEEPVFRCGKFLAFWHNITEGNKWFCLIGRKRSLTSILYETIVCGILTVLIYARYEDTWTAFVMIYLMFAFMVAFISDIQWREIPHEINYITMSIAVVLLFIADDGLLSFVLSLIPAVIAFMVALTLYALRPDSGFGIGGGDLRFILSMGGLMGVFFAIFLLAIGSAIMILLNIASLIKDVSENTETFVPMMTGFAGAFLIMLFGHYLAPPETGLFPMLDFLSVFSSIGK